MGFTDGEKPTLNTIPLGFRCYKGNILAERLGRLLEKEG